MNEEERKSEEVDVEPFEGAPDFDESPTAQTDGETQDLEDDDA